MARERGGASFLRFAGARVRLPVARWRSAFSAGFEREDPCSDQLLEHAVQRAAVRLVAKLFADVVTVENLRNPREHAANLVVQLPSPPARRARRRSRDRLRRRSYPGLGDLGVLLGTGRPDQLQGTNLLAMGRLQQLDPGAELLVQPLHPLFVFVACHDRGIASPRAFSRKRGLLHATTWASTTTVGGGRFQRRAMRGRRSEGSRLGGGSG